MVIESDYDLHCPCVELRGQKTAGVQIITNFYSKTGFGFAPLPVFFSQNCQQSPMEIKCKKGVKNYSKGLTNKKGSGILYCGDCDNAIFWVY